MTSIQNQLADLCKRFSVDMLYAFGSRALEARSSVDQNIPLDKAPKSDLDVGVKTAKDIRLTVQEKVSLAQGLEDLFGVSRVDLIVITEVDPFLALDIIRGELLYCRDYDAEAEHELLVLRRAGDLAPYARERWNQILGLSK